MSIATAVIACAYFMYSLDITIVAAALPGIAQSFGADPVALNVIIAAYLVAVAAFVPLSGWLCDRFGARTIFQAAVGVFTLGSVLCGLSSGLTELVVARVIQGMGGALVIPVGRFVVVRTSSNAELVRAIAWLSVPAQVGAMLGGPVGGLLVTYLSWPWIFLMNVPIGLVGMLLAARYIENFREDETRPFDWLGFALSAVALADLVYALEIASQPRPDWPLIAVLGAVGIVVGAFAVRHMKRRAGALIDFSLLAVPSFRANFWAAPLIRMTTGSQWFLLQLMFQLAFGLSAFASSLLIFVNVGGSMGMRSVASFVLRRYGFRNVLMAATALNSIVVIGCGFLSPQTPIWIVVLTMLAAGCVVGLHIVAGNSMAYSELAKGQMSGATTLAQTAQQLGNACSIAIASLLLRAGLAWRGADQLVMSDFLWTFVVLALISGAALPIFRTLPPNTGAQVSGHRGGGKS